MSRRLFLLARCTAQTLVAVLLTVPASAQAWEPDYDPTLNCDLLPHRSPTAQALGLPAALAAAERRELALGPLGYALVWAEREPDPAYIPVLKRLVEEYRCSSGDAGLAMIAIEAAGEPVDYFVNYVQDWRRSDTMAEWAINALAIRGDSSAFVTLDAIADELPTRGRFGRDLYHRYRMDRRGGLGLWRRFEASPVSEQIDYAMVALSVSARGVIIRNVAGGDSLSGLENEGIGYPGRIARRALRRLALAYPSQVATALVAYEDTVRAQLARAGVSPARHSIFLDAARPHATAAAFPPTYSLPSVAPPGTEIAPSVCIEDRGGQYGYGPDDLAAVFSYGATASARLAAGAPIRIPHGEGNTLSGPWDAADPLRPVSPEVFFPDTEPGAGPASVQPGRPFRVAFRPGEAVAWTLLGQTVTASAATRRCDAPTPVAPYRSR